MKKLILLFCFMLLPVICLGSELTLEKTSFGLKIGESTPADIESLKPTDLGINKVTGGPSFDLEVDSLGVEDLRFARVAFDAEEKLVGIFLRFGDAAYDQLADLLSQRYPEAEVSSVVKYGLRAVSVLDNNVQIEMVGSTSQQITALTYLDVAYLPKHK